jgi:hypothetical protein
MGYFVRRGTRWRLALMAAALVLTGALSMRSPSATEVVGQVTEDPRVQYRPSARVRVIANIVFARYGKRALKLDLYRLANFTKVARAASTVLIGVSKSILNFRLSANISNPSLSIPVIATALTVVTFNTLQ